VPIDNSLGFAELPGRDRHRATIDLFFGFPAGLAGDAAPGRFVFGHDVISSRRFAASLASASRLRRSWSGFSSRRSLSYWA
jgi:hypothetical protein